MNRSAYGIAISLLIITSMLSGVLIIFNEATKAADAAPTRADDPIIINSQTDFDAMVVSEGWPGTGVPTDPYIISGYTIEANGGYAGIFIGNVSYHFVLRDIDVSRVAYSHKPYRIGAGMHLHNVQNVWIDNCNVKKNEIGVYILTDDGEFNITGCNISENNRGGVLGYASDELDLWMFSNELWANDDSGLSWNGGGGVRLHGLDETKTVLRLHAQDNVFDQYGNDGGTVRVGWNDFNITARESYVTLVGNSFSTPLTEDSIRINAKDKIDIDARGNTFETTGIRHVEIGYGLLSAVDEAEWPNVLCDRVYVYFWNNNLHDGLAAQFAVLAEHDIYAELIGNDFDNSNSDGTVRIGWASQFFDHTTPNVEAVIIDNTFTDVKGGAIHTQASEILEVNISKNIITSNNDPGTRATIEVYGKMDCSVDAIIMNNTITDVEGVGINVYSDTDSSFANITGNIVTDVELPTYSSRSWADPEWVDDAYGIWIENNVNSIIKDNIIMDTQYSGISVQRSKGVIVEGNEVGLIEYDTPDSPYFGSAIDLVNTNDSKVIDNHAHNAASGVNIVSNSNRNLVSGNLVNKTYFGMAAQVGSEDNIFEKNTIIDNSALGILAFEADKNTFRENFMNNTRSNGIAAYRSDETTIRNNTITVSEGEGILLFYSESGRIVWNRIDDCREGIDLAYSNRTLVGSNQVWNSLNGGIMVENSHNNTVMWNLVRDTEEYGMVFTDSRDCIITENSLMYNNGSGVGIDESLIQAYDNTLDNSWDGNYWSDMRGPDANGDKVVDISYPLHGGPAVDSQGLVFTPIVKPPEGVKAVPGNSEINLKWEHSHSEVGEITMRYWIYREASTRAFTLVANVPGTQNEWKDETVENGLAYSYYLVTDSDAGRTDRSATSSAVPDNVPPEVNFTSPSNNSIFGSDLVALSWVGSDDNSGIDFYRLKLDETVTLNVGNVETYELLEIPDGEHTLVLTAFDAAGNSAFDTLTFTTDSKGPLLGFISPVNGSYVNSSDLKITWNGSDETTGIKDYSIRIDGGTWNTVTDMNFTFTGVKDGSHFIELKGYDLVNNEADINMTIFVDTVAPGIDLRSPQGTDVPRNTRVQVNFTEAMDNTTVKISIDGVQGPLSQNGTRFIYSLSSLLEYRTYYTVSVEGTDLAGNWLYDSWEFRTRSNWGTLNGIVMDENGDPIEGVVVIGTDGGSGESDESGEFSFEIPPGMSQISFSHQMYFAKVVNVTVSEFGELSENFTLTLKDYFTITGRLVSGNGTPIVEAEVFIDGELLAKTNSTGYFNVEKVSVGQHKLVIKADGYKDIKRDIEGDPGDVLDFGTEIMDVKEDREPFPYWIIFLIIIVLLLLAAIAYIIYVKATGFEEMKWDDMEE